MIFHSYVSLPEGICLGKVYDFTNLKSSAILGSLPTILAISSHHSRESSEVARIYPDMC
jgi:hypothetical protein